MTLPLKRRPGIRWMLAAVLLLSVILVPFVLFEDSMTAYASRVLGAEDPGARWTVSIVILLLASDVVLPIPSSIVNVAAGYRLGAAGGTLSIFVGMSLGCVVGYALGASAREPLLRRLVTPQQLAQLADLAARHGDWVLALCRPIPVLAEASVIAAGASRRPYRRFLLVTSLANAGVALVYGVAGSLAASAGSLLIAMAASIALPLLYGVASRGLDSRTG